MTIPTEQLVKHDDATDAAAASVLPAQAPDTFPCVGRVSLAKDTEQRAKQGGFNLLVLDVDTVAALELFAKVNPGVDHTDGQGQSWVSITVDPTGLGLIRRASRTGAVKIVVEGILTIVDVENSKPVGFMRVTGARPATFNDGGRIVEKTAREPGGNNRGAMPNNLGFNARNR